MLLLHISGGRIQWVSKTTELLTAGYWIMKFKAFHGLSHHGIAFFLGGGEGAFIFFFCFNFYILGAF